MPAGMITGLRGVDLGVPDVAAERNGSVYPPGHSDLWGATPPPTARIKAAQQKIEFAKELFHPYPAEHALVPVVAAERGVAVGRNHLEHALDRSVLRISAETSTRLFTPVTVLSCTIPEQICLVC